MKYMEFDKKNFKFQNTTRDIFSIVKTVIAVILVSSSFTVVAYLAISLLFSTRTERKLKAEIAELKEEYRKIRQDEPLLADVITEIQLKDSRIYESVFNSEAPNVDPVGGLDFLFGSDTIPDYKLISYTTRKASELEGRTRNIDSLFGRIFEKTARQDFVSPPMSLPVKGITYMQVGASEGMKINPFYKAYVYHRGLDIITQQGDPVYATADGLVIDASRSRKGHGNVVEIRHEGGYTSRYAHLMEINVRKGRMVKRGDVIGTVGMSGSVFSPHLHYEVMKDSVYLDPVNCIFSSVSPEEYANMLFMAANTRQSLD